LQQNIFKKLTTETTRLLSQLLSKNHIFTVFTSNFQCVRLATGWRIEAGHATDQWPDQPNAAALCPTQRQWLSLAGWLSWIVNIDRPSVEGHPEQHNQLDLSLGCLGATCQARSTLITQPVSGVAGLRASSDISQGSVVTHFGSGGIYSNPFFSKLSSDSDSKNENKNRLIFGEVMTCTKNGAIFGPPCMHFQNV